jgi:hypothetical protein
VIAIDLLRDRAIELDRVRPQAEDVPQAGESGSGARRRAEEWSTTGAFTLGVIGRRARVRMPRLGEPEADLNKP